jgi:hypothetical protein
MSFIYQDLHYMGIPKLETESYYIYYHRCNKIAKLKPSNPEEFKKTIQDSIFWAEWKFGNPIFITKKHSEIGQLIEKL